MKSSSEFIKKAHALCSYSPTELRELDRCTYDPIYFIENYVKIQHPKRGSVPFVLYDYQKDIVNAMMNNNWVICKIFRQAGKCVSANTQITISNDPIGLTARETTFTELEKFYCFDSCSIVDDVEYKLKFIKQKHVNSFYVLAPSGFVKVKRILKTVPYVPYTITFTNGNKLTCADKHILIDIDNNEVFAKDLKEHDCIITHNGMTCVASIEIDVNDLQNMFDLELESKEHVYFTNGILSHNTAIIAAFLLWEASFYEDKLILVASNKNKNAMEIVNRITYAYENLPHWIKPGITSITKHSIDFDNDSRILSQATTADTGRGLACITGASRIRLKTEEGVIRSTSINMLLKEFIFCNTTPHHEQQLVYNTFGYEIETPHGWCPFHGLTRSFFPTINITFDDSSTIECSYNHRIKNYTGWLIAEDIKIGDVVIGKHGFTLTVTQIQFHSEPQFVYDIYHVLNADSSYCANNTIHHNCSRVFLDELAFVPKRIQDEMWTSLAPTLSTGGACSIVSTPNGDQELFATLWTGAEFDTNGFFPITAPWDAHPDRDETFKKMMINKIGEEKWLQEYETVFISSDSLLINSKVLLNMRPTEPINTDMGFRFWKEFNSVHTYYVAVDIAAGDGGDFSNIEVIEFPTNEQVAQFRSNKISPNSLYNALKWIINKILVDGSRHTSGKIIPQVYWSFENNSVGQSISALYYNDEKAPECTLISTNDRKPGIVTTGKTKAKGCAELKRSIERKTNTLKINSHLTIVELKNYVGTKTSYAARPGATDDSIAALLIFGQMLELSAGFDDEAYKMVYNYDEEFYFGEDSKEDDWAMPMIM